jgi:hypothetical protein
MFIFACTLALLGVAVPVGLGVAVTAVVALEFVLSAVLQADQKAVTESKSRKAIVRRIEVPPVSKVK